MCMRYLHVHALPFWSGQVVVYIYWRTNYRIETLQDSHVHAAGAAPLSASPSLGCLTCNMGMCLDNHH